jgi:hypothetical protein
MSRYPVRRAERALLKVEKDAVEVIEPVSRANPFFSFRYSYTEISASSGKARVKSRNTRFEDGKLTSEAFEGELEASAYEQMVNQAQHHFLGQTALMMKALSWLLPFSGETSSRPRLINPKQRCSLYSWRPWKAQCCRRPGVRTCSRVPKGK